MIRLLPPNARSRLVYDEPKWRGYEVVLDVFPGVIANGVLLVPKDLKPMSVAGRWSVRKPRSGGDGQRIRSPATRITIMILRLGCAKQGFHQRFAPQNLYLFEDRFRVLQRKANPLGRSLFFDHCAALVHQQTTDWLKAQPFVDPEQDCLFMA